MIFKIIGFVLGLSTLGLVLFSLATGTAHVNLPFIAALVAVNVLIGFVLPKFIKRNAVLDELKSGSRLFALKVNGIVVGAALAVVYVLGVGLTFIFSRFAGKRFMRLKIEPAMWQKIETQTDMKEMF